MRLPVSQPAARVAAKVATVGLLLAAALQLLLALGVVPVSMAWGGTQPVLTLPLRIASLIAVVVLALSTYVIRRRAGLVPQAQPSTPIKVLAWVIAVYLTLNTVGNFASASTAEAMLFGPISLISALACLLVPPRARAEPYPRRRLVFRASPPPIGMSAGARSSGPSTAALPWHLSDNTSITAATSECRRSPGGRNPGPKV
jgi:hypothetical protein